MQAEVNMRMQGQNANLEIMRDSTSILIKRKFYFINYSSGIKTNDTKAI